MHTPSLTLLSLCALSAALPAAIVQRADYALGEAGSISATQPYTPLVDSIGGNNIPNWNTSATKTSVITTGLAAPGSTAALLVSGNAGTGGTWFGGTQNGGSGYTSNWALDIYLRPDATGGTFLGATDGNGGTQTGLRFWATNTGLSGTSLGGNNLSSGTNYLLLSNGSGFLGNTTSTYTAGTWVRLSIINYNGTVNYYLNESLQDSAATDGFLNDIRLGAGYFAAAGSNGAFDEMRIWDFDHTQDSLADVETAVFTPVPEPSSSALIALGALGLIARRRR
ncbi:PEP-CTERM sorting domain-containing protein [Rubritalea tangerina]|uniref:PEP-CTERM sorting domain-containing protein n=1 Tax=Rubritalea tangerina TaxID=430798 RepID=A0ABW4ZD42_9BACT